MTVELSGKREPIKRKGGGRTKKSGIDGLIGNKYTPNSKEIQCVRLSSNFAPKYKTLPPSKRCIAAMFVLNTFSLLKPFLDR